MESSLLSGCEVHGSVQNSMAKLFLFYTLNFAKCPVTAEGLNIWNDHVLNKPPDQVLLFKTLVLLISPPNNHKCIKAAVWRIVYYKRLYIHFWVNILYISTNKQKEVSFSTLGQEVGEMRGKIE